MVRFRLPLPFRRLLLTWWKRNVPHSLWGRALLIIVLPVALMQVAVTWAFFDAHWETVTARLSEGLAGDIAWAVESYKDDPTPENLAVIADRAERSMQLSIVLQPGKTIPERRRQALFAALDRSLKRALTARLDDPYWFDTTRYPAYVDIRVQVTEGVIRIIAPRDRAFATRGHIFVLWLGGATLLLTTVAILFIRNQVRSIERLADAAEAFGKGLEAPNFKPAGALEVRRAAQAFLDMRARIARHIDQRTTLLASVSHDLRTPLTRMKLELALSPPSRTVDELNQDVREMEHMIDEYLSFARGESGEVPSVVRLDSFCRDLAFQILRNGIRGELRLSLPETLPISLRPTAMRRALSNLILNALSVAGLVQLSAEVREHGLKIFVDDNGPGIAPDQYEEALKPFSRLDPSRNQNTKGVGLGLAISQDIIRGHGGDLKLSQSPLGGLRVTISLPR